MEEIVVTIRLNEKFLAKSYISNTLFKHARFENIGSRRWEFYREEEEEKHYSKMHFVKMNLDSLETLKKS